MVAEKRAAQDLDPPPRKIVAKRPRVSDAAKRQVTVHLGVHSAASGRRLTSFEHGGQTRLRIKDRRAGVAANQRLDSRRVLAARDDDVIGARTRRARFTKHSSR